MESKSNGKKVGVGAVGAYAGFKTMAAAGILKWGWMLKTFGSMFVSLIFYATSYGWGFAATVIVLLFVHEMGHWVWMKLRGLNPESPVFIPFLGAYVAMKNLPPDEATNAWVAFSGPFIGGAGAFIMWVAGVVMNNPTLMAGGSFGFLLNLFQLIPAKPLDGGFIAGAISRWLLIPGTLLLLGLGLISQSGLLIIIGVVSAFSLFKKKPTPSTAAGSSANATAETAVVVAPQETAAASAAPLGEPTPEAASVPPPPASTVLAASAVVEMKPASGWQRFFIGFAYISLALFLGLMTVFAQAEMSHNKKHAGAQIAYLSEQIKRDPDAALYRERSGCYAAVGRIKEAEQDRVQVCTAGSDAFADYLAVVRYRLAQGLADDTTKTWINRAMAHAEPKSGDMWSVGVAYYLMGDYTDAVIAADKCDDTDRADITAAVQFETGHAKEASASYPHLVKQVLEDPEQTQLLKVLSALSAGDTDAANIDCADLVTTDPDSADTRLECAWNALAQGKFEDAINEADACAETAKVSRYEQMDYCHMLGACHVVKQQAYLKLAESAASPQEKQKFLSSANAESDATAHLGVFATTYVPKH